MVTALVTIMPLGNVRITSVSFNYGIQLAAQCTMISRRFVQISIILPVSDAAVQNEGLTK